ncbi:Na+/H+ antiporter NhaA [Streptomyces sp. NPDC048231]|uniref:Na+/H+ antiporter NhaA n=1 Tax=Streptomyces sp. NPDC048231 TaxID=3365519 RepID=UPI00371D0F3B
MGALEIVVVLASALLIILLGWYFFGPRRVRAARLEGGVQRVEVTVRGGYSPDLIRVRQGTPVELVFDRQEAGECTSRVIFPELQVGAGLPAHTRTTVRLSPDRPGAFSTHLPSALRAFLPTLVDDLGAILVIAVFFTPDLNPLALSARWPGWSCSTCSKGFGCAAGGGTCRSGVAIWALMHDGGVHATVEGVAMSLILRTTRDEGEKASPGERTEHLLRPAGSPSLPQKRSLFAEFRFST